MGIFRVRSMIVEEINFGGVLAFKLKHDPPVAADCDAPKAGEIAREAMKAKAGKIERSGFADRIEREQYTLNLFDVRSWQASRIVMFEELLEPTVPETQDHLPGS